jgi:hypothetical protein
LLRGAFDVGPFTCGSFYGGRLVLVWSLPRVCVGVRVGDRSRGGGAVAFVRAGVSVHVVGGGIG